MMMKGKGDYLPVSQLPKTEPIRPELPSGRKEIFPTRTCLGT
ncbi:MAG: hypothetical protein R3C61_22405 [Bacteroidia bacterium]